MNQLIIIIFIILSLFSESLAKELPKIEARYLTSYTSKFMGGSSPSKLYFDHSQKELYIADSKNKEITIIDEDGLIVLRVPYEKFISSFCVNKNGDIYLSEGGEISILNYRGEYIGKLDLSSVPEYTSLIIQSLHIDKDGFLYIGDAKLSRIIVLDSSGKYLYQFGKKGKDEGEFINAKSITTDANRVYVLDPALFRVTVYNKKGKFVFMFGTISSLLGGFSMPANIDTDGERLYVVDSNKAVVIVFDREGKPIIELGGIGNNLENLSWPSDVRVNSSRGIIYICDTGNGVVKLYKLTIPESEIATIKPELVIESAVELEPFIEPPVVKFEPLIEPVVEIEPLIEPEIELIAVEKQEEDILVEVFKNLEFESSRVVITPSSYESLDKLYELMVKKPMYRLRITGHTDNIGAEASNLRLGQERADAVKIYLQNKGIVPSRITTVSFGESMPIADNDTEEGRAINRRVEFTITK